MTKLTAIQKLYRKIPCSSCKEGCFLCCTDLVQLAPEEKEHMGGYEYNGQCSHLENGKCTVYEKRPFVCRLYGASEMLFCEDCIPEGHLSINETKKLVGEYARIKNQQEK